MKNTEYVLFVASLLSSSAFAQQAPLSADDLRREADALISAVRQQRDENADGRAQALAKIAKLSGELETAKADMRRLDAEQDEEQDASD